MRKSWLDRRDDEDEGLTPRNDEEAFRMAQERPRPPRGHEDYERQSPSGLMAWLRWLWPL
jgi:hypothetical protein